MHAAALSAEQREESAFAFNIPPKNPQNESRILRRSRRGLSRAKLISSTSFPTLSRRLFRRRQDRPGWRIVERESQKGEKGGGGEDGRNRLHVINKLRNWAPLCVMSHVIQSLMRKYLYVYRSANYPSDLHSSHLVL